MLMILLYSSAPPTHITEGMLIGAILIFFAAYALAHVRQRMGLRIAKRYRAAWPNFEEVKCKFFDDYEVEVVARCARIRTPKGDLDEKWVDTAEAILKAGLKQFPDSSYLNLVYSNFLFSVRNNGQAATVQLSRARKTRLTFGERFMIFVRDRERKQRSGTEQAGDAAMDLVSYVEFQNNYRALLQSHMAALKAIRSFWRELLKKDVSFNGLSRAFHNMDLTEAKAEKVYRMVLERYPKSVKLLRTYGKFLEGECPRGGAAGPGLCTSTPGGRWRRQGPTCLPLCLSVVRCRREERPVDRQPVLQRGRAPGGHAGRGPPRGDADDPGRGRRRDHLAGRRLDRCRSGHIRDRDHPIHQPHAEQAVRVPQGRARGEERLCPDARTVQPAAQPVPAQLQADWQAALLQQDPGGGRSSQAAPRVPYQADHLQDQPGRLGEEAQAGLVRVPFPAPVAQP